MDEEQGVNEHIRQAGNEAAEAAQRVVHAGASAGEEAAEAARRVVHAGAKAGEEFAEAGSRTARAGATASRELADAGEQAAHTGSRIAENAATAFREMVASTFDSVARLAHEGDGTAWLVDLRGASRNLDSVLQSNAILARGMQPAWIEWAEYSRRSIERNAKGLAGLARSRSADELITRQVELLKANIEDWLHSSVSLFELSADTAREAAKKVKESANQHA